MRVFYLYTASALSLSPQLIVAGSKQFLYFSALSPPPMSARWRRALQIGFPSICFALGTWQLYRMQWKRQLVASLEEGLQLRSISLDRLPYPASLQSAGPSPHH